MSDPEPYTPSTQWVRIMVGYAKERAVDRTLSPELARAEGYGWFDRWLRSVRNPDAELAHETRRS